MRVFVTGAAGFIGSAVVRELTGAGHQVLGLARNDANAEKLKSLGAQVHRGDLTDLDSLTAGARTSDGVIHLAFVHDFAKYAESNAIDLKAVQTLTGALEGTGKPFVGTSGTMMLPAGRVGTEHDGADPAGHSPRVKAESEVVAAGSRGVRASVVRLAPTVHDAGDRGFVPALIELARKAGYAAYIGAGTNHWPAVHRLDAATLFRLALEKATPGQRLHGAAEQGIPTKQIAETIGAGLGLPVKSLSASEAPAYFTWLAGFFGTDNQASNASTRETLGWAPTHAGLLEDLRANYFAK
jgi:nucleoside-diphosphate-sugar epimerase